MPGYTFAQAEDLWVQAGGPPQIAAFAAAIADASSGLNPDASTTDNSGITYKGLWQIPSTLGNQSSTDPMTNARAAVSLSNGGTDFQKWKVAWSDNNGGQDGGTYLGDGSNAVASLAQVGGNVSNISGQGLVVSALPTGESQQSNSDSIAAMYSGTTLPNAGNANPYGGQTSAALNTSTPSSSSSKFGTIAIIAGIVLIALWFFMKRSQPKIQTTTTEEPPNATGNDV